MGEKRLHEQVFRFLGAIGWRGIVGWLVGWLVGCKYVKGVFEFLLQPPPGLSSLFEFIRDQFDETIR